MRDGEGPPEGLGTRRDTHTHTRCFGVTSVGDAGEGVCRYKEGRLSAGAVFGGTRGYRCRRSRVPVHMRTQSKRVSEPPSLAATSSL